MKVYRKDRLSKKEYDKINFQLETIGTLKSEYIVNIIEKFETYYLIIIVMDLMAFDFRKALKIK